MVDWGKPIRFENGEPCTLENTLEEGQRGNFGPEYRRIVRRPLETNPYCSLWWFKEDGKSHWPGYDIVNVEVA